MPIPTTTFGCTDLLVGRLGFGGSPVGGLGTPETQIGRLLELLLDSGVNLIDTAGCYGSEPALGRLLAGRRDEVVLVTKGGFDAERQKGAEHTFTREGLTASLDRSLRDLQTDHVDVLLLHSCDLDVLEAGEAVETLVELQKAGKTRFVGYSGDNAEAAWAARDPRLQVVEMSVNLCDQRNLRDVLPLCREHEKAVIAKRPLANAAWKRPDEQPGHYRDYASEYTRRFGLMELSANELGYFGHAEVEWPEIALKYALHDAGVHVAIAGTTSTVHTEINLAAASKNELRGEVVQKIEAAYAAAERADAGDAGWPSLR